MATMTERVIEKKSQVRKRHGRVADAYRKWLDENPRATKRRRVKTFDALVDSAFLEEHLKK